VAGQRADAVEVHLGTPDPFVPQAQMIYENVHSRESSTLRTTITVPVLAKLGAFRNRACSETHQAAPWTTASLATAQP